jgi:DNA polymerase III epsilon subunit-like protein
MKHLNSNVLGVIDVETTGAVAGHHDMIEICCVILDGTLERSKDFKPFVMNLKPKRPDNIDLEAMRVQRKVLDQVDKDKVCGKRERVVSITLGGVDADRGADMFFEWFENLRLPPMKRIMPIAHNWVFDRSFILDWLGPAAFNYIFDPRYRDTMCMSLMDNDVADWRSEPHPYAKNNLQYLCSTLHIDRHNAHTALDDVNATIEVYKKLVKRSINHVYS